MAWIRACGGGKTVKEHYICRPNYSWWADSNIKTGINLTKRVENFTVGVSGTMHMIMQVWQLAGSGYSYTIDCKHNDVTFHTKKYDTGGVWYYLFDMPVLAGDVFKCISPEGNCQITLSYYID